MASQFAKPAIEAELREARALIDRVVPQVRDGQMLAAAIAIEKTILQLRRTQRACEGLDRHWSGR